MIHKLAISGILLFVNVFVFGQNADLIIIEKYSRVKNHSGILNREGKKDLHNLFRQTSRNISPGSLLKSAQANKQRLDSYLSQEWNESTNQWDNSYNDVFVYDVNGNATKDISSDWDGNQWSKSYEAEYTYDLNGRITQFFEYSWTGNQRDNSGKSEYSYNSSGTRTQFLSYYWDGNLWANSGKSEYTYNSNGNLTKELEYYWDMGNWTNSSKYDYTYDSGGHLTKDIGYYWDGSQWVNSYKSEYSYDSNGNMTNELEYEWDGSQWGNSYKYDYAYDANGNMTQYLEYEWDGSQWGSSYKSDFFYNNSYSFSDLMLPKFLIEETSLLFNHMLINFEESELDYNSGLLSKMKTTMYYSKQNATSVAQLNNADVSVYPNPVFEDLSFSISGNYSQITFELFDIQGRKLLSKEIKDIDKLSLKSFNAGLYFYCITTDGQRNSGKLLKN